MIRTISLVTVVLMLVRSGPAQAQIKVVKKPAPAVGPDEEVVYNTWSSSWGLRDDPPNRYPLGIATHKTEAEAVAAARAHIARTAGNGALAVTHYLIEGEPSVQKKSVERVKQGMELLARLKEAKEAVDHARKVEKGEASVLKARERKLGDTIKEYKDMVAKSYGQAVEAKKTLTGGVAALTDAKMREVNGLIDKLNREVQDFQGVMGRSADLGFGTLARIEAADLARFARAQVIGIWKGTYSDAGGRSDVTMRLDDDGTITSVGRKGRGTWVLEGDSVKITWTSNGAQVTWYLRDGRLGNNAGGSSISLEKQ